MCYLGPTDIWTQVTAASDMLERPCLQAELIKQAAAAKQKLSSAMSSLAQAEQAKAASVDTILMLKEEIASAEHLDRLARGDEFLAVRKTNQRLSVCFPTFCIMFCQVFFSRFLRGFCRMMGTLGVPLL